LQKGGSGDGMGGIRWGKVMEEKRRGGRRVRPGAGSGGRRRSGSGEERMSGVGREEARGRNDG